MHYIVLGGGSSPERDVSLRSAIQVNEALVSFKHETTLLDPQEVTMEQIIDQARQSDGVFPILHGEGGEDGVLQSAFEAAHIPFFGSTADACRKTFDKVVFKQLLQAHHLPTPAWNTVSLESLANEPLTNSPFVIKPIQGGSSIDTFIVRSIPFDDTPIKEALGRYETMLIEVLIEGTETTVGVLESTALPVIEIIPPQDLEFDYENKYNGATQELCPPVNVSTNTQLQLQALAEQVHSITGCRHLSRTDILIDKTGAFFIIDTNTIPGLTAQSLYPKAALVAGLSWPQLVQRFTTLVP